MRNNCCWRADDAQLDGRRQAQGRDAATCARAPSPSSRSSERPGSSSPTTLISVACAPSAAALRATLAAPPGRSSLRAILTTGHRRLGRDALDVAEPVAIEHHVADDQQRTRERP